MGLLILKHLTVSLDSSLLLQSAFGFQESLLKQQEQCIMFRDEKANYVVDDLFLIRNLILYSTFIMGGPSERSLPSLELSKQPPIFQCPVPNDYMPDIDHDAYFNIKHSSHQSFSDYLDSLDHSLFNKDKLVDLQVFLKCNINRISSRYVWQKPKLFRYHYAEKSY